MQRGSSAPPTSEILAMHSSARCGAKTRSGPPCRSPAMPNGRYSAEAIMERSQLAELIKAMRTLAEGLD